MGCGDNHAYSVSKFSVFLRIGVKLVSTDGGFTSIVRVVGLA